MNIILKIMLSIIGVYSLHNIKAQIILNDSSLATIYFYRNASVQGVAVSFDLHHRDSVIGRVASGSVIVYQCPPGVQEFWGSTESRRSIFIDVKPGKSYFVRCSITVGGVVGLPSFRQVSPREAVPNIAQILQQQKLKAEVTELYRQQTFAAESNDQDTLRALNNLYERKRKGGTTRGVVFLILSTGAIVQTAESGTADGIAGATVLGLVAVTGFSQSAKYNTDNLQKVLSDYANQVPLSENLKKKFKKKDFEW
jgi:hypothetical protein